MNKGVLHIIFFLVAALLMSACSNMPDGSIEAERYNAISYDYHYKDLDSAMHYALKAAEATDDYDRGLAEALNNKAFVYIQQMHYDSAKICLDEIARHSDNQIELAVADVQNMRLCQRRAMNKDFYDYRESARKRLRRIEEEQDNLSERLLGRLIYARTEFNIVNSVYYYYVGMQRRSERALKRLNNYKYLHKDTAQYLNYLFQKGTQGKMSEARTPEEIQSLMRCYFLSSRMGYVYWKANSLQMIAECMASEDCRLREDVKMCAAFFNISNTPDELSAGVLANQALDMFMDYGDTYQVAGTYRTLASCYLSIKDYQSALFCLDKALHRDTLVNSAPDLVAGIRELMSVTYSAMGDKQASDYNRNIYLDLQEMTRQDRKFEARAEMLDSSLAELNIMIAGVVAMIIILLVLLLILSRMRRRRSLLNKKEDVLAPLRQWKEEMDRKEEERNTRYEETGEKYNIERLKVVKNKRRAADNRAKIALAETVSPLIDRMLNEVRRAQNPDITEEERARRLDYVSQIAGKINDYNTVLTEWIELRRGMISMNIESFALQDVFDLVSRGSMTFSLKGITLNVEPTDAVVKADKVLTLFMINTIADNARKHTAEGGHVDITAVKSNGYTDISVTDNGCGMTEEQLSGVFSRDISGGHGFGLVNCKGIIEKYRKTSRIFDVCSIKAESEKGRGSRFTFRLPSGIIKTIIALFTMFTSVSASAETLSPDTLMANYADSIYYSNVGGYYHDAIAYADSVVKYANQCYRKIEPNGKDTISVMGHLIDDAAEVLWLNRELPIDYTIILDMRNETAVAALALHYTDIYRYNNKAYTSLFKELSSDKSLPEYCSVMQKSKNDKTIAVILLVLLLLSVFPAYYFFYYRHVISHKLSLDKINEINRILHDEGTPEEKLKAIETLSHSCNSELSQKVVTGAMKALNSHIATTGRQMDDMESAEDDIARAEYENDRMYVSNSITDNCLSTLKHETMYYPARISQLVRGGSDEADSLLQLVEYYRDLYNILMLQSRQQTNNMVFENKRIALSELLHTETDLYTKGDKDVMEYMFEILRKESEDGKFSVSVSETDPRYVIIETYIGRQHTGGIFVPSAENIPFLLCRGIIRDHSEMTGLRGCGIDAVKEGERTKIIIKLTRK